jgi:hypothetical protein
MLSIDSTNLAATWFSQSLFPQNLKPLITPIYSTAANQLSFYSQKERHHYVTM